LRFSGLDHSGTVRADVHILEARRAEEIES